MNKELWGKEIFRARKFISEKQYTDAKRILDRLILSDNEACVIDAKKLLIEITLTNKNNLDLSLSYCREILNKRMDVKYLQYFIELSNLTSTLNDSLSYILDLKNNLDKSSSITINFQLIYALVSMNKQINGTVANLLSEVVSVYKEVEILDDNYLYIKNYPSFAVFIDLLKDIQNSVPSFELASYIKDNLNWIDETGKQILNEKEVL